MRHVILFCLLRIGACQLLDGARLLYDEVHKVETARLYGSVYGYAYWFVDILIGTPTEQRTSVITDTGSVLCGFPCSGCHGCGHHIDQAFAPEKSESFSWVECREHACQCRDNFCRYSQSYTEGSSIAGRLFHDWVRLGDDFQSNPFVVAEMGCHDKETKLFTSQKANGIMGLAVTRSKSRPSILQSLFASTNAAVFSMCLAQFGGAIVVGGYNSSYFEEGVKDPTFVSMNTDGTYQVQLSQLTIPAAKYESNRGFGRTIVDSGTTYTYFPSGIYRAMLKALDEYCKNKCPGRRNGRNCYSMQAKDLHKFPVMNLNIGGEKTEWKPRSYLYPGQGGSQFCLGFDDNGSHGGTVLGATWMIDHEVIFDIEKKQLGIANAHCPSHTYKTRPDAPEEDEHSVPLPPKLHNGIPEKETEAPTTQEPPTTTAASSEEAGTTTTIEPLPASEAEEAVVDEAKSPEETTAAVAEGQEEKGEEEEEEEEEEPSTSEESTTGEGEETATTEAPAPMEEDEAYDNRPLDKEQASAAYSEQEDDQATSDETREAEEAPKVSYVIYVLAIGSALILMTLSVFNVVRWLRRRISDHETMPLRDWMDQDDRGRSNQADGDRQGIGAASPMEEL